MDTNSKFFVLLKNDATPLIVLLSITLITRLLLIMNAPFVYHFDAYAYVSKAIDLISSGTIQFGVGVPFVVFLGGFYYLFSATFGALSASRILMLLMSMLVVSVIYLFGLKLSGKIFGFIAALIATFEPLFLSYSIVPHNDVFSIAMGLAALYFATSGKKFYFVLSPFFFYIAIFTRPELSVLAIPILLFSLFKLLKRRSIQTVINFVLSIIVFVLPLLWIYSFTQSYTRFGIVEKLTLFFTSELLNKTLSFSLSFYNQLLFNQVVFSFIGLGIMLGLFKIISKFFELHKRGRVYSIKYKKECKPKKILSSERGILTFLLFLVFMLHIIVLAVYSYGYVIVNGELTVLDSIPERYFILPRLLTSFPLAYPMLIVLQKFWAEITHEKSPTSNNTS